MKISVALCTYNGEAFVEEQLRSIIDQTRPPDEIVIGDDRSSDGTVAILERTARRSRVPIRWQVNEENLGSTANFGEAIDRCIGDLIFLSDQDDVWLPRKVEIMAAAFDNDAALGALFSDLEIVDEDLNPLGYTMFEHNGLIKRERAPTLTMVSSDQIISGAIVTGATLAFRSALRSAITPMPQDSRYMIHDGWIGIVAAAAARLAYLPDRLVLYRQHQRQQIGARKVDVPFAEQIRTAAQRGRNDFEDVLGHVLALREELGKRLGTGLRQDFERALNDQIGHLRLRTSLPAGRLARILPVTRELLRGRYHRFSNGAASALKDVVGSGAPPRV